MYWHEKMNGLVGHEVSIHRANCGFKQGILEEIENNYLTFKTSTINPKETPDSYEYECGQWIVGLRDIREICHCISDCEKCDTESITHSTV